MISRRTISGICFLVIIFCACGNKQNQSLIIKQEHNEGLERIENHSFNVPSECLQIYEGTDCRAVSAHIKGIDYMIAYNPPLHSIDLIALDGKSPFKQIRLDRQGPNGVPDVRGVFHYENTFVLKTSAGFCRVDTLGNRISSWNMFDYLKENIGFSTHFPEKTMVYNFFFFIGFDEKEGLVALPLYKFQKENNQYPNRVLILSCKDWQIEEELEITYPEYLKKEEWFGCLGEIQVLPHGDKVIYNFPASTDIFVYDRKTKTTQIHHITTKYTDQYYRCEDRFDSGVHDGYFLPIRYDSHRRTFWRVQHKNNIGAGMSGKAFSVTQLSTNFEVIGEYDIPERKEISSYSMLFTKNMVLFPYLGGEYIGLDNMAFYGLKLKD